MYCFVMALPKVRTIPSPNDCATEPAKYECASSVLIDSCACTGELPCNESTDFEKSLGMVRIAYTEPSASAFLASAALLSAQFMPGDVSPVSWVTSWRPAST